MKNKKETSYYIDLTAFVKVGDEYGNWYIVGQKTTRHYYSTSKKDCEIYSKQICIKNLKEPKKIDKKDIWKY